MTKAQRTEQAEQIARLREWIKPGDTVYTVLDHVSSSGMSRAIRVLVPYLRDPDTDKQLTAHDPRRIDFRHPNYAVGVALGLKHWKRNGRKQDALVVGGCGMDMGFHLVYSLSHVLYGASLQRDIYLDSATTINKDGTGPYLTRADAPEGQVYVGGYQCLGKGQCPSNYHVNHRDRLRCDGADGRICWKPDRYGSRYPVPEDWPTGPAIDIGEGATLPGPLLACLHTEHEGAPYEVCPTCKGAGDVANPDGPERWDLVHTDGYALRHRWL